MSYRLALLVFTDGRLGLLEKTMASFDKLLRLPNDTYEWTMRLLTDDSGDKEYMKHLHKVFGSTQLKSGNQVFSQINHHFKRIGFCASIAEAWRNVPKDIDFVFHLEDDFELRDEIHLQDFIDVLNQDDKLAQVSLVRQAWNQQEKAAGGLIQAHPGHYEQWYTDSRLLEKDRRQETVVRDGVRWRKIPWLRHRRCFTTNPSLYPRRIVDRGWPVEDQCEGKFSIRLLQDEYVFAAYGELDDLPRVIHIGNQRIGGGY